MTLPYTGDSRIVLMKFRLIPPASALYEPIFTVGKGFSRLGCFADRLHDRPVEAIQEHPDAFMRLLQEAS